MSADDLRNPVLRGSFPDPSLVRVGDWFYLATSSFQWFPTIPLHRSRDLRTWEYVGSVDTAAPHGLAGVPDSGGIWAPALSHDGERFWITYAIVRSVAAPTFDLTVYVATAHDPAGPWSQPTAVTSHGFDPSIFHEGGRHWLLNLQNDTRPEGNRFAGIVLRELVTESIPERADTPTPRAVGPTHLLWQQPTLIEGPKVVHHGGWYYLVLAEGGTGYEHGVRVARSRDLTGPYELDAADLLTTRTDPDSPLQKAGHAELVECADGTWVASLLAARPVDTPAGRRSVLGRETAIETIAWVEGWPRLAAGGTRPRAVVPDGELPSAPPPAAGGASVARADALPTRLGTTWPWSSLREPVGDWAAALPEGGLRLRGRADVESLFDVSLLAARVPEHRFTAQVVVDADPTTYTQSAGLTLVYQADAAFTLHVTWSEPEGEAQRGQQWEGPARGRRVVALVERAPAAEGRAAVRRTVAVREIAGTGQVRLGLDVDSRTAGFAVDGVALGERLDVTTLSDDVVGLRFTGLLVGVSAHDPVDRAFEATFSDWRAHAVALEQWAVTE